MREVPVDKVYVWNCYFLALAGEAHLRPFWELRKYGRRRESVVKYVGRYGRRRESVVKYVGRYGRRHKSGGLKNWKISGLKKEAPVDKVYVWNCYFLALAGEGPI